MILYITVTCTCDTWVPKCIVVCICIFFPQSCLPRRTRCTLKLVFFCTNKNWMCFCYPIYFFQYSYNSKISLQISQSYQCNHSQLFINFHYEIGWKNSKQIQLCQSHTLTFTHYLVPVILFSCIVTCAWACTGSGLG